MKLEFYKEETTITNDMINNTSSIKRVLWYDNDKDQSAILYSRYIITFYDVINKWIVEKIPMHKEKGTEIMIGTFNTREQAEESMSNHYNNNLTSKAS